MKITNIKIEGIGAKTRTYFWINAFIREFIATIYSERKKHILINILLIVFNALLISFLYFNKIL